MEANELRIGNWVEWFHPENGFFKCQVDIDILNTMTSEYFENSDTEVYPIPLTKEWLIKFGFEYDSYIATGNYYKGGDILKKIGKYQYKIRVYCSEPDEWFISIYQDHTGKSFANRNRNIVPFKHVHQLQNLYFALTGNELVCKDK